MFLSVKQTRVRILFSWLIKGRNMWVLLSSPIFLSNDINYLDRQNYRQFNEKQIHSQWDKEKKICQISKKIASTCALYCLYIHVFWVSKRVNYSNN